MQAQATSSAIAASSHLEPIVLVLLVVSLCAHLLKLGDLVLRPHQKKAVQAWSESLTLYLQDARPLTWFQYAVTDRSLAVLSGMGAVSLIVGLSLAAYAHASPLAYYRPAFWATTYGFPPTAAVLAVAWGVFAGLFLALGLGGIVAYAATSALFEHTTPRTFILRFIVFLALAALIIPIIIGLVSLQEYLNRNLLHHFINKVSSVDWTSHWAETATLHGAAEILLGRAFFWVVVVFIPLVAGMVACLYSALLVVGHLAVRTCSALAWRVVEYEKGAWAAILLLVTVALGVIEALLKFGR